MRTQVTPVAPQGGLGPQKGREAPTGAKRQGVAKRRLRVEGTRVRDTGRRGQSARVPTASASPAL